MLSKIIIPILNKFPAAKKNILAELTAPPVHEAVELKHVYTDKKGNNYYTYADITKIPYKRSISADIAMRYLSMNITADELQKRVDAMIESCNKKDLVNVAVSLTEINKRLNMAVEEKTLTDLACVYFLIDGEKPDGNLDPAFSAKKKAMWKEDNEAKGFFLNMAFGISRGLPEPSTADINTLLEEIRRLELLEQ